MKNVNIFTFLILLLAVLGLTTTCAQPADNPQAADTNWGSSVVVPGTSLSKKLQWLSINAQSDGDYTVVITANESIDPTTLAYGEETNITIKLIGVGINRIISLKNVGSMFTVETGVTLILDGKIELQGRSDNIASLIRVNSRANLILNSGAKIIGNTFAPYADLSYAGGVSIFGGTFTMNGGEISGNFSSSSSNWELGSSISYAGGVHVERGLFIMNGGKITSNSSFSFGLNSAFALGGGVSILFGGTFTMNGGEISGNTTSSDSHGTPYIVAAYSRDGASGAGVYVSRGTFKMSGGKIIDNTINNTAVGAGGGVYVTFGSTFIMSDGVIAGNSSRAGAGVFLREGEFNMTGGEISHNFTLTTESPSNFYSRGGGVCVSYGGVFNLSGGTISCNIAAGQIGSNYDNVSEGGGVSMTGGTFIMNYGVISGNCSLYGGGVYIIGGGTLGGTFTMNSGEISGNHSLDGGGVCVFGTFTMCGGEILGNYSTSQYYNNPVPGYGGGVYVNQSAYFIKTGGTIFGYLVDDSKSNNANDSFGVLQNNNGHAVCVYDRLNKICVLRKDSKSEPIDNLLYNGVITPPVWSGAWDY